MYCKIYINYRRARQIAWLMFQTLLRRWALGVARRAGVRKAKVGLARKLAVILHRMLVDGAPFDAAKAAAAS